jgi:hypothetical protein
MQMAAYYGVFLVSGPLAFIAAVALSIRAVMLARGSRTDRAAKSRKPSGNAEDHSQRESPWACGMAAILAFLIAGVHLAGTYGSLLNGWRWSRAPSQIAEIRIEAFRGSRTDWVRIGNPVTISDRALIAEGFEQLTTARPFHSQHEHYLDGYRIRLKYAGAKEYSDRYLSIYSHTDKHAGLNVVIPHIGPVDSGAINNAGDYDCKGFHQWFRKEVVPEIQRQQRRRESAD